MQKIFVVAAICFAAGAALGQDEQQSQQQEKPGLATQAGATAGQVAGATAGTAVGGPILGAVTGVVGSKVGGTVGKVVDGPKKKNCDAKSGNCDKQKPTEQASNEQQPRSDADAQEESR